MPVYEYDALDSNGKTARGIIDADTAKDAREKLRKRKLFTTRMAETGAKKKGGGGGGATPVGRAPGAPKFDLSQYLKNPRRDEITAITRQLATLLAAGIPLVDALEALIQQCDSADIEKAIRIIKEDVQSGLSFGDALQRHPVYFTDLYVNMIRAGEASGALDAILKRLADFMQAQNRMKNRVSAALVYPMIMGGLGVVVVIFLLTFVVPRITKVLTKRGGTLPLPTEILLKIQSLFVDYWFIPAGIFITIVVVYKSITSTEAGKLWRDTVKLKLPVFGDLFRKQSVSRFATTFATLLRSGIQATECLRILENVVANKLLSKVLGEVRERIIEGTDIATPLKKSGAFPPVVGYMIAVGEQSGQLEDILERISETYDEEVEITTAKVTALVEPLIIVAMAVIVGFIVLAVVMPLVQGFKV